MAKKGRTAKGDGKAQKKTQVKVVGSPEKDELFKRLIVPHLTNIKALSVKYTDRYQDAEDNYIFALQQMYAYINTYDESKSLETWIHIVTKRACYNKNRKRAQRISVHTEIAGCSNEALYQHGTANMVDAGFGNLADNLSDVTYNALLQLDPRKLSAFLLYAQGMNIREITRAEYLAGHLEQKNETLIKSRIYWAKAELKYILKQHGFTKSSYTSSKGNQPDYPDFDEEEVEVAGRGANPEHH